ADAPGQGDVALRGRQRTPVDLDRPGRRLHETCHRVGDRGRPRATETEETDAFAGGDVQVDVLGRAQRRAHGQTPYCKAPLRFGRGRIGRRLITQLACELASDHGRDEARVV